MQSIALPIGDVTFPSFTGVQVYMAKVLVGAIDTVVPTQYRTFAKNLVKKANLDPTMEVFVTIDERVVEGGTSHRRGGAHIDGNFLFEWSGSGDDRGGWLNGTPGRMLTPEQHRLQYQSSKGGLVIASNYPGCDVWLGEFDGVAGQGGDCEHLRDQFDDKPTFRMEENRAYLANSTCVHQSMPIDRTYKRQLFRLTLSHEFDITCH